MYENYRHAITLIVFVLLTIRAHAEPPKNQLTIERFTFTSYRSGESTEAEMGTLVVPYNRSDPDSYEIALKFVRFPATTNEPGPPLVYLAGGRPMAIQL